MSLLLLFGSGPTGAGTRCAGGVLVVAAALAARPGAGPPRVLISRVPARTVRLGAFQLQPLVVRRDERRFAGSVTLTPPHRPTLRLTPALQTVRVVTRPSRPPGGSVLLTRLPGVPAAAPPPSPARLRPAVVRREERPGRGIVLLSRPPARTIRLAPPQLAVLVIRRDQRRAAGRVSLGRPAPLAAAPPAPVDGSLRTVRVVGGRGRLLLPQVPGIGAAVPASVPRSPLAVRRDERWFAGRVLQSRVPGRTVRLAPPQTLPRVIRRDQRGTAGAVLILKVPARTVRLAPFQARALVVPPPKREPPRGAVLLPRVPARTVRRGAFQTTPVVVRRDERRYPGSVTLAPPRRPTVPLPAALTAAGVVTRPSRPPPGLVLLTRRVSAPAAAPAPSPARLRLLVVRRDERPGRGAVVLLLRVPARSVRLAPPQLGALIVRRAERSGRPAVLIGPVPRRTVRLAPPQLAVLIVRRDERRYGGFVLTGRPARVGAAPVAGSLRTVRVIGGRGRLILPQVPGIGAAAPPSVSRPPFVLRRDERRTPGLVLTSRLPARTVRLAPPQTTARVVQRDERRSAGRVFQSRVPARTLRLGAEQLTPTIVRRDERGFAGRVLFLRPAPPPTVPQPAKRALVVGPARVPARGSVTLQRLPARTVRLIPPQLAARVVARDQRGFAGRVVIQPPTRTGAAVIVPRLPKPLLLRLDQRGFAGRVTLLRVPAPTLRLTAGPLTARVVRRDQRGFGGSVLLARVPARTVRLAPPQLRATVVRRDQRGFGGQVLFSRRTLPVPVLRIARPALVVQRVSPFPPVRPVLFTRPYRVTLRLTPGALTVRVAQRPPPRPAGTPGSVLFVRPPRPRVVAGLPKLIVARRDERGYRGRVLTLPVSRQNAVIVSHGNPRATVALRARPAGTVARRVYAATITLRSRPAATVTLRARPTATLNLRRPSATLELKEG